MGLEALLILLFFFLPGLIADALFRFVRWMPEPPEGTRFVRAALFSAAGLLLLLGVSVLFEVEAALPAYLFVSWAELPSVPVEGTVRSVLASWSLHVLSSAALGLVIAFLITRPVTTKALMKLFGQSLYESAWQEFVRGEFNHWVRVRTADGTQLYGRLGIVSGHGDRGVVLWQPSAYDESDGRAYITVDGTKGIYLPEGQIAHIAVAYSDQEVARARAGGVLGRYELSSGRKTE